MAMVRHWKAYLISDLVGCSLTGDFGFDPFRLGEDPAALKWCAPRLPA